MASLTDVAKLAKVSIATASRVINNSDKVVPATRAVVQRAMEELGYQPSRVARRLRQKGGRRHLLGLILPDIQNPFFAEVARGVEDVAYANQFAVLLCNSDEDLKKEAFYLDVMRAESVDGVILPPIIENDPFVLKLAQSGMPIVCVDRALSNASVDTVEVDNYQGAYEAVRHLITLGHKRIGLIAGRPNLSTSRDRRRGYEEALNSAKIPVRSELIRVGDNKQASGRTLAEELLGVTPRPTALFVSNNLMAVGALEAIHARKLGVPAEVALIGFDDLPWAEALDPPLTVVRQPAYEVGAAAAELLLKRLGNRNLPASWLRLQPRLILRSSC
jgi:DNA-binding LacI/PurR family transcriptional regulator